MGAVGELPGKMRQYESGYRGLGARDGARKPRGLAEVHPEVLNERSKQPFSSFLTQHREEGPLGGKQKTTVGEPRKAGSTVRKLAK